MAYGWTRPGRRPVRLLVAGVLAAVWLTLLPAAPVSAQQPSAADIQWAQTILRDKGFKIGGRPNGQMTPETRSALSAYQKSVGLPTTGQLDRATIDRMLAERSAAAPATVGNLATQRPGGGGPGQAPRAPEREVVPRAASRTGDVQAAGGDGAVPLGPVVRGAGGVGGADPAPRAAPSGAVTATTADGRTVAANALSTGDEGSAIPGWVRYAVMAVLAATVGVLGVAWWRSGRAVPAVDRGPAAAPSMRGAAPTVRRREPTFTAPRDELTAGPLPPLTSGSRGRGR
ncbi:peptidoglycan-binding domain-containing protein [Azospirillum halopraeferens]|uniref:peptidoglycan-binding domain-containing protein n=1 Tax=Azospirillum halopraeferens TaxID=34010 RepID=UPI0004206072|nr:peptidoglycan-binding domain-containing protein [Azospirillum halopraeferens]